MPNETDNIIKEGLASEGDKHRRHRAVAVRKKMMMETTTTGKVQPRLHPHLHHHRLNQRESMTQDWNTCLSALKCLEECTSRERLESCLRPSRQNRPKRWTR